MGPCLAVKHDLIELKIGLHLPFNPKFSVECEHFGQKNWTMLRVLEMKYISMIYHVFHDII